MRLLQIMKTKINFIAFTDTSKTFEHQKFVDETTTIFGYFTKIKKKIKV